MRSLNLDLKHAARSAELAARFETVVRGLENGADGQDATRLADDIDALLERSTDSLALRNWQIAAGLLRVVAVDLAVRAAARAGGDVGNHWDRLQVILQGVEEAIDELDDEDLQAGLRSGYDAASPKVTQKALLPALLDLPLSTLYSAEDRDRWPRRFSRDGEPAPPPRIPVLRLIAFLDNAPLAATQALRPHTLHTLRFQVRGTEWPATAQRLRLELLSTCPPTLFHSASFETAERSGAGMFEATVSGGIQVNATQSEGAPDVMVSVRAAFALQDGIMQDVPVVGHNQLRFRISAAAGPATTAASPPAASASGLAPGQFAGLLNALLAAYNSQSLRRMLRTKLDVRLDQIAGNGPLTDAVHDVIDWAEREGRVEQLVREASAFVPGNEQLQRFAAEFERIKPCQ